ncbi:MAG: AI-2E family transporter [Acidimicrobiales bacterium]
MPEPLADVPTGGDPPQAPQREVPAATGMVRMTVGPQVVAVVLVGIAVGLLAFGVADAARRVLGWAVASAVVAALLEPLVRYMDRFVPRVVAILGGLLIAGVLAGSVIGGILADLGNQFDRLRDDAPRAASELEESERFGDLATDFRLEQRVEEVLDRLRDPTSGLASEESASAASAYLVCTVLTAFFLSSGPGVGQAALDQIRDDDQRSRAREIVRLAFSSSRTYVLFCLAKAGVFGVAAWGLCYWEDVPAPIVAGVTVAALSVVPGFGIFVGGMFPLLLEAGLGEPGGATRLAVAFLALQIADALFIRSVVVPRSLAVGPAAIVIGVIVGFEVYGIGGALYAAILAIFGVAILDAAGSSTSPDPAVSVEAGAT